MADEPAQEPSVAPTEPPAEKPEEKKEEPVPAEQIPEQMQDQQRLEQPKEEVSAETSQQEAKIPESLSTTEVPPVETQPIVVHEPKSVPQQPSAPQPEGENINIEEKIQERLKEEENVRRKLANEARAKRKSDNLDRLLQFAKDKKILTNSDARDFLHISQSTATNYLAELVKRHSLKREGKRGGTRYQL